jgi:hypothetical protein
MKDALAVVRRLRLWPDGWLQHTESSPTEYPGDPQKGTVTEKQRRRLGMRLTNDESTRVASIQQRTTKVYDAICNTQRDSSAVFVRATRLDTSPASARLSACVYQCVCVRVRVRVRVRVPPRRLAFP